MNTALSWFEITSYTTLAAIAGYRIVAGSVTILDSRPTRLAAGTPLLPFAPVSIDCKVIMRERSLVDLKTFLEMHEVWCLPTSKSCWTPVKPFYVGNKCNSNSLLKLSPYVANRELLSFKERKVSSMVLLRWWKIFTKNFLLSSIWVVAIVTWSFLNSLSPTSNL